MPQSINLLLPFFALILDFILGDPEYQYHPVRLIGALCIKVEAVTRKSAPNAKAAGFLSVISVIGISTLACWFALQFLAHIATPLQAILAIIITYTCIAMQDMTKHTNEILKHLEEGDKRKARLATARIVGRDTVDLDERELARAAIESIAENTVDGTTAVLFYAIIGAAIGGAQGAALMAVIYRCINTMDSMFGYKNETYRDFGFFPAKLDDFANYLPARLTVLVIALGAKISGFDAKNALRVAISDGQKHPSPNSGLSEAAFAGALNIRLGGDNYYKGVCRHSEYIAAQFQPPTPGDIKRANQLLIVSSFIFAITGALVAQIMIALH